MNKSKRIVTYFTISILILLLFAAIWQKDNLSAIIKGISYSSEELEKNLDQNREKTKEKIKEYTSVDVNDLTAEDEKKLLTGEVTLEEIEEKYDLPIGDVKERNEEPKTETKPSDNQSSADVADKLIGDSISKMYALKAYYVQKLGEVERKVISEYKELPEEKQNAKGKKQIISNNIGIAADLEKQCDDKVASLLKELETELKKLNHDTEVAKVLKEAYQNEKETKKSYYLSLYDL